MHIKMTNNDNAKETMIYAFSCGDGSKNVKDYF